MSVQRVASYGKMALLALAGAALIASGAAEAKTKKPAAPAEDKPAESPVQDKKFPTKSTFELKSINGKPIDAKYLVSFMLDDSFRASGGAGCNNWSATIYPSRGQRLAVGPIALTRKECDKDAMNLERLFTSFLHASPMWDINGSEMTFKLQNTVMVLQRSL